MLISKDENFHSSALHVASLVLKCFSDSSSARLSIYDLVKFLKKNNITHYRQILMGLIFLYSVDILSFEEPYFEIKKNRTSYDKA
jgi:hypothetical protein